ncbi:MAG: hypothetical protein K2J08_06905 [Ruminococcus sp.]|nr:hypothetical protein [Ruminococcus sp.]
MVMYVQFPVKSAGDTEEINFQELADQIGYLVNEARTQAGLNPVYMVPYLNEVATARCRECLTDFSHDRHYLGLKDPAKGIYYKFSDMFDENFPWLAGKENIANTMRTAEATFNQWKNSPQHWANILDPQVTHLGVGVVYEPDSRPPSASEPEGYATAHWYWTQIFIKADDDPYYAREYLGWTCFDEKGNVAFEGQYMPEMYQVKPTECGDLNGDGVIDSFDLVILRQYLTKQTTLNPLQVEAADVMYDGVVSYSDLGILRGFILGKYDSLPVRLW